MKNPKESGQSDVTNAFRAAAEQLGQRVGGDDSAEREAKTENDELVQKVLAAIQQLPQWQFLDNLMSEAQGLVGAQVGEGEGGDDDGKRCPFCGWQIHGCDDKGSCEHHLTNIDTSEADGDYIYSGMGGAFDRSKAVAIGGLNEVIDELLKLEAIDTSWVKGSKPSRLRTLIKAVLKNTKANGGERDGGADLSALIDYFCQVCDATRLKIRYTTWDNNIPCCSSSYLDIWANNPDAAVRRAEKLMADDLKRLDGAVRARQDKNKNEPE